MKLVCTLLILGFLNSGFTFDCTWYGESFQNNYTKSGERFDINKMTCASNHFEIGTRLKITNLENKKTVVVRVNDTGAFKTKTIDLSLGAFTKIANPKKGRIKVNVKKI